MNYRNNNNLESFQALERPLKIENGVVTITIPRGTLAFRFWNAKLHRREIGFRQFPSIRLFRAYRRWYAKAWGKVFPIKEPNF